MPSDNGGRGEYIVTRRFPNSWNVSRVALSIRSVYFTRVARQLTPNGLSPEPRCLFTEYSRISASFARSSVSGGGQDPHLPVDNVFHLNTISITTSDAFHRFILTFVVKCNEKSPSPFAAAVTAHSDVTSARNIFHPSTTQERKL